MRARAYCQNDWQVTARDQANVSGKALYTRLLRPRPTLFILNKGLKKGQFCSNVKQLLVHRSKPGADLRTAGLYIKAKSKSWVVFGDTLTLLRPLASCFYYATATDPTMALRALR